MIKLPSFMVVHKLTLILVGVIFLVAFGGVFAYQRFFASQAADQIIEEIDLNFDPEGPYAILTPRRDGNAVILNLKRTASYDKITYELAYNAEGIDRGVMGEINTQEKKGEYEQEILFGTCSKNVCKYDKGVENGTLTLHIRKGSVGYRMITQWRLQKPDVALGELMSGDSHFNYKINSLAADLAQIAFSIINDLTGAPKLPSGKVIFGKVYAVNVPLAKSLPKGQVLLELAENPTQKSQLARFDEVRGEWVLLETDAADGKMSAPTDRGGIFAVLSESKQ